MWVSVASDHGFNVFSLSFSHICLTCTRASVSRMSQMGDETPIYKGLGLHLKFNPMALFLRENPATLNESKATFFSSKKSVFISKFKWDIFLTLCSGKIVNNFVFWTLKIRPLSLHKGSSVFHSNFEYYWPKFCSKKSSSLL